MVPKRKADLLSDTSFRSSFEEGDFTCYSEENEDRNPPGLQHVASRKLQ